MKKLMLGFDLDCFILDLLRPWLDWYNKEHGDNVTIDDVAHYDMEKTCKKGPIYGFFDEAGHNYKACPVMPGAAESLLELKEAGHEIVIATYAVEGQADFKWHLVKKAAPWMNAKNVIVIAKKELLALDVFGDDAPKNVVAYHNRWPEAHLVTIAHPYNRDIESLVDVYAQDHNNTVQAWRQITDYIHQISE